MLLIRVVQSRIMLVLSRRLNQSIGNDFKHPNLEVLTTDGHR